MIDNMKISEGYQPPKLQQFDGKGNPKQYITHFIETCNLLGHMVIILLKSSLDFSEKSPLNGTQILNLILWIVGTDYSKSSLIISIARDMLLV